MDRNTPHAIDGDVRSGYAPLLLEKSLIVSSATPPTSPSPFRAYNLRVPPLPSKLQVGPRLHVFSILALQIWFLRVNEWCLYNTIRWVPIHIYGWFRRASEMMPVQVRMCRYTSIPWECCPYTVWDLCSGTLQRQAHCSCKPNEDPSMRYRGIFFSARFQAAEFFGFRIDSLWNGSYFCCSSSPSGSTYRAYFWVFSLE